MNHPKSRARVGAILVLTLALAGCATLGEDPNTRVPADAIAVRAEQTYQATSDAADFLFGLEDAQETVLESKFPGFHNKVEALRLEYRVRMPQLLAAIDKYKATRDQGGLAVAIAIVSQLLADINIGIVVAATGGVQ